MNICYCPRSLRKMPHGRTRNTKLMDRTLFWALRSQGQRSSINTELSPDRGRPPDHSQRSLACSTITEEREVSWSWQHPSRTLPSRWRGCNHRSHDNLQQDLMTNPVDPVLNHYTFQERQLAAEPEYRTISLISHPRKIMLRIILKRLRKRRKSLLKNRQAS